MSARVHTRLRRFAVAAVDGVIWATALLTTASLDPSSGTRSFWVWVFAGAVAVAMQWSVGYIAGLYRGRASVGSADQAVLLAQVVAVASIAALFAGVSCDRGLSARSADGGYEVGWVVPRTVVLAGMAVLMASGALRFAARRTLVEHRPAASSSATRVLIFGAGVGGQQLIQSMIVTGHLRHGGGKRPGDLLPVGILDDDPARRRLRILGVPVVGTGTDIAAAAVRTNATMLVLAIPSADAALIRRVVADAAAARLSVKTLPAVSELRTPATAAVGDMRDVAMTDLLGRRPIDTDLDAIAGYLTGRRVLVTGAGGSIGSELCRQIQRFAPAELIMLDRDESALHAVQLSLFGAASLDTADVVLADIRDSDHMLTVFLQRRPDVVFHAAALKHLTMLEQYPGEAIKTNVWGTAAVLAAAEAAGVSRFVNISTDKAANPCSVLGYSKRVAERLTAAAALEADGTFLSVRFGNVLGSRGSVVTTFTSQIEAGVPVTVTDPEVTRYFMTVQEAVQLVIQSAAIGSGGEALVLDMGEPVRIADVARQLITMSGRSSDIVYTGLHAGEKLHEELFGSDEVDCRPMHHLISHVPVPPISTSAAFALDPRAKPTDVRASLAGLSGAVGLAPKRPDLAVEPAPTALVRAPDDFPLSAPVTRSAAREAAKAAAVGAMS